MKLEEFGNLKVGDKVQIVSKKTGDGWNINGYMDKWLGKVMTIKEVIKYPFETTNYCLRMKEDQSENIFGWHWFPEMIEKKVEEYPTVVEHLVKGNKTIIKLSNGKVGVAACSPEDEFDPYEGFRLASARAYGKEEPFKKKNIIKKETSYKEVNRVAKVGEYIKIINPVYSFEEYGDILRVSKERGGVHYSDYPKSRNVIRPIYGDEYWYHFRGNYVVLEGYDPKKENK